MIEMRAAAQAAAIRIIAEALNGTNSAEAAKLAIAREVHAQFFCNIQAYLLHIMKMYEFLVLFAHSIYL